MHGTCFYDDLLEKSIEIGSFLNFNNLNSISSKNLNMHHFINTGETKKLLSSQQVLENINNMVLVKYKKKDEMIENSECQLVQLKTNNLQKKREMHSLLLFIFFLFVTIITLSQILVMHSQSNSTNFYQIKIMQEELKQMDASIDKMLREKKFLPMNLWFALKQFNQNLKRFHKLLNQDIREKKKLNKSSIFEIELEKCKNVSLLISEDIYKKEQKAKGVYNTFLRPNNDSKYSWYSFVKDMFYKLKVNKASLTKSYQKFNKSYNNRNLTNNEKLLSLIMRDSTQEFIYCFEAILNFFFGETDAETYDSVVNTKYVEFARTIYKIINKIYSNKTSLQRINIDYYKQKLRYFVDKHKSIEKQIKLNQSICDSQPPNLCKLFKKNYCHGGCTAHLFLYLFNQHFRIKIIFLCF
jgi:hypothetical protein